MNSTIKSMKEFGIIHPSSIHLANEMIYELKAFKKNNKTPIKILEVGSGDGAITDFILSVIDKNDTFISIEKDNSLFQSLQEKYKGEHVDLMNDDIKNITLDHKFDFIISSLPVNNISAEENKNILKKYKSFCKNGCILSFYEYILISLFKPNFKIQRKELHENAIRRKIILKNIPPASVCHSFICK